MLKSKLAIEGAMASDLHFTAILDRLASERQHYVNRMEDNWVCKEMMSCI
jgi:hypothetical protein